MESGADPCGAGGGLSAGCKANGRALPPPGRAAGLPELASICRVPPGPVLCALPPPDVGDLSLVPPPAGVCLLHSHGAWTVECGKPRGAQTPQVLARKGLRAAEGSGGVMWARTWPPPPSVSLTALPLPPTFLPGRQLREERPAVQGTVLAGPRHPGGLQAPLQRVPGTATCLTAAAPLAPALRGSRGAASCCQADPEIAVTSGTQLGSPARAAYVRRLSPRRVAGLVILDVASQGRVRALSRGSRRPL